MNTPSRIAALALAIILVLGFQSAFAAATDPFAGVKTQADLDALIASTSDAALKQAMQNNAAVILAAAAQRPHVEAVIRTIESMPGKFEKSNTTPPDLKKAAGGDIALFDTLKLVDLQVPGMGPHDKRKVDPYDQAFFEHLGQITALESLNIISTKADDQWVAPLGKLTNLKALRFVNNGKLTDAGLENFAALTKVENFSYVGTQMLGHAFVKFENWTKLTRCSFRGSSIDDEGLRQLCEHFPNLESISLAHAKFTDAGAVNLAKLTKLKGLELGTHNATPQCLINIQKLPLEYLQLGEGFDGVSAKPTIIKATLQAPPSPATDLTNRVRKESFAVTNGTVTVTYSYGGGKPLTSEFKAGEVVMIPRLASYEVREVISLIKDIKTLHRLTLTNGADLSDSDLKLVAGMTQLESLELNSVDFPDERLALLQSFSFLKSMRLANRPKGYPPETQAKIKAMLPKVALTFE